MNKERLYKIADEIESENFGFNMSTYVNSCGTAACIAGFSAILFDNLDAKNHDAAAYFSFFDKGKKALDLTEDEAWELFMCNSIATQIPGTDVLMQNYDNETIVKTLRVMIDKGDINWEKYLPRD